ncbi:MAG: hypothetical protein ABI624_16830 [Casimicrobiaceae bacterium]
MVLARRMVVLASVVMSWGVSAAPAYVAVPLNALSVGSVYGTGINSSGQVVGFRDTDATGAAHRHAFLWAEGVLTDLGTLPGGTQSFARAINDSGKVVGSSNAAGGSAQHAVVFNAGTITDLGPALQALVSTAYAINNAGDIAGGYRTPTSADTHAFRLSAGSAAPVDLGTFGGTTSQAYGINVFGAVTGFAHTPTADAHAFRFDNRGMVDLGTLGGIVSIGQAIGPGGEVVGSAYLPGVGTPHAFLHDGATQYDLGTLGGTSSTAYAINAANAVVGEATMAAEGSRAFLYVDGAMIDLNTVTSGLGGGVLSTATAINDAGQIVAMRCTAVLVCPQAYRLDPVPASKVTAIEYHHAAFDHYFVTANADEIGKLDAGVFAGWTRTGESFNVFTADQVGTKPVCRFFSTSFAPKSSHFYAPDPAECAIVKQDANWELEGIVFRVGVPDGNGVCAAGTQPVYRLYNDGMGAAPNHRYTTQLATRAATLARGWIPEGYGPLGVVMCSPI